MIKTFRLFLFSILLNFKILSYSYAQQLEVNRDILAIWDSSEYVEKLYEKTELHRNIEAIFNFYGYKFDFIDVGTSWPSETLDDPKFMDKFTGIISWFNDDLMPHPKKYLEWLNKQIENKKKIIILGEFGFFQDALGKSVKTEEINKVLEKIGIQTMDEVYENPLSLSIKKSRGKKYVEFERGLENELMKARWVKKSIKEGEKWLQISILGPNPTADVVFTTPFGGYAQSHFEIFRNPSTYNPQWRINPFIFVKEVMNISKFMPIPEVSMICGKRITYTHIDGDGFVNKSYVDKVSNSGKIVLEELIKKYKFPTTVSIIVAEINPQYLGNDTSMEEAKEIFGLPYVEIASHTYFHPLSWEKVPNEIEQDSYLGLGERRPGPIIAYGPKKELDYNKEITESIEYINKNLSPPNKNTKLLLWSGSCKPPLEALELTKKINILNMNGGDSRFDKSFDSYANVAPLYRKIGNIIQTYTSNANENMYTNLWTGPFNGQREVITTFKNTYSPILFRPMNIYYHFYSGEHTSSLEALDDLYRYIFDQDAYYIYASKYVQIIQGYIDSKIQRIDDFNWIVSDYGELRTFRIDLDDAEYYPDYAKSINIIGHKLFQGSLYLYLGEKEITHISLTKDKPKNPYIRSTNLYIQSLSYDDKNIYITGKAYFQGNKALELNMEDSKKRKIIFNGNELK